VVDLGGKGKAFKKALGFTPEPEGPKKVKLSEVPDKVPAFMRKTQFEQAKQELLTGLADQAEEIAKRAATDPGAWAKAPYPRAIMMFLLHQKNRLGKAGKSKITDPAEWVKDQLKHRKTIRVPRAAKPQGGARGEVTEAFEKYQNDLLGNPELAPPPIVAEWLKNYLKKIPVKEKMLMPPGYDLGHKKALCLGGKNDFGNLRLEFSADNQWRGAREAALAKLLLKRKAALKSLADGAK
jgi:hypothetical protein